MSAHGEEGTRRPEEAGRDRAVDPVTARLYDELRELAAALLKRDRSVDPTDLVHDCYLRLAHLEDFRMTSRPRFLALAASVLRHVLVDQERRRRAQKRGEGWRRTTLAGIPQRELGSGAAVDLLDLEVALERLEDVDPRQHRIVELRFFAGLSGDEIADLLGVSRRTVTKEWTLARAWLRRELGG